MLGSWVLDDRGDVWPEASRNLGLALHTKRRGAELTNFLVRQMGFVIVRELSTRNLVTFDPEIASPVAMTALLYWLADRPFTTTVVENPARPEVPLVFHKLLALQNHVGAVIERRTDCLPFELQPLELDASVFDTRWRAAAEICRGGLPAAHKISLLEDLFAGKYIVATRRSSEDYTPVQAGSFFRDRHREALARILNSSFREAPDEQYGAWTADHFQRLRSDDTPCAAAIRAMVRSGHGARRISYDRLVVPHRASSGHESLLIASNLV